MTDADSEFAPSGRAASLEPESGDDVALVLPIEARFARRWPALRIGVVVSLVLFTGAILYRLIAERLGAEQSTIDFDFATRAALVASVGIGYTLAAVRWISLESFRDLQALGLADPEVDAAAEPATVLEAPLPMVRRSRWAGLAGVLFFVATIEIPSALAGGRPLATWFSFHSMNYMLGLGLLFFWFAGRAAYYSIGRGRMFEAEQQFAFDLLDRGRLRVVGRMALRGSLAWVIGFSIASLIFVNPEVRLVESLIVFVPILLATIAIAAASLLLPLRALRRRVGEAKRSELVQVEAAIRGETDALRGSRLEARGGAESLADLITYRDLIESVPEWPFDASAIRRFGLYLLIPIGSWVGGALVERGVSAILD